MSSQNQGTSDTLTRPAVKLKLPRYGLRWRWEPPPVTPQSPMPTAEALHVDRLVHELALRRHSVIAVARIQQSHAGFESQEQSWCSGYQNCIGLGSWTCHVDCRYRVAFDVSNAIGIG